MTNPSSALPPLALYVHLPWCVRKCPYCDFNSHALGDISSMEPEYVQALVGDLRLEAESAQSRKISSIFFGGGTPSLFSESSIAEIIEAAEDLVGLTDNCEITLEANPGTAEQKRFAGYRAAGVNRLSIGAQSFSDEKLELLGRIHSSSEIDRAIEMARSAGFDNLNVDLMHGLPNQTAKDAVNDLQRAFAHDIEHLSWYELTIEPNTEYFNQPPALPDEAVLAEISQAGSDLIRSQGYQRYEISAYCKPGLESQHNLNYWQFGDYLGIGAGAHGKVTRIDPLQILRTQKSRLPEHYLENSQRIRTGQPIELENLPFEFLMNALRLIDGSTLSIFCQRTGLDRSAACAAIRPLLEKGFVEFDSNNLETAERFKPTELGVRYLNDALGMLI